MSIKQKLIIIPGIAILVFILAVSLTWINTRYQLNTTETAHDFNELSLHLQALLRGILEAKITEGSEESIAHAQSAIQRFESKLDVLHTRMIPLAIKTPLQAKIIPLWSRVKLDALPFLRLGIYLNPYDESLQMALGRLLADVDELLKAIYDLGTLAKSHAAQVHTTIYRLTVIMSLGLFTLLGLGFFHLYSTVARPINRLRAVVSQVPRANPLYPEHLAHFREILCQEFILPTGKPGRHEISALVRAILFMLESIEQHLLGRTKSEEALRRSQAMLRLVIDHIPEHIYWKDQHAVYQGCSVNYAHLAGLQNPLEIHGKTDFDLHWSDEEAHTLHEQDLQQMASAQTMLKQLAQRGQEAHTQWLEVSKIPLRDANGAIIGLLVCKEDISERKSMELALRQERELLEQRVWERTAALSKANEQLSRLAKAKDEFLAAMSHELRTPLTAILGLAESLLEEVHGPLSEKQERYLRTIEESGQHLLSLINDILDVAKVESGMMELHWNEVDIALLCHSCLRLIKQPATQKALTIHPQISDQLGTLPADSRRLKQILVNLLGNAVKFTPEHGEIGLNVERDEAQGVVRFCVWDTGIGIAKEHYEKLFMPFVQLDSRLARNYNGTGLGLALVYRMTELHGGSVQIDSQVNQGSRFTVSLPLQQKNIELSPVETAHLPHHLSSDIMTRQHNNTTVLIAEDNEENIHTLVQYLQMKGYQICTARNGQEAIYQANVSHPTVIVMDIQMPKLDGLEAIRHIRATHDIQHIPIIALTALAMPGDQERCLAAGANAYLSKPVQLHQLTQLIDSHVHAWSMPLD